MKIQLKNFDRFEEYKTEIIIIISIFMGLGLILSYNNYEKYLASFLLFSFSSYLLIIVGIFQNVSFGILVFSLLLWMGFWLKNIVHLIFNYDYLEPIGNFDFSLQSINDINLIITISFFSIIISVFLISIFHTKEIYIEQKYTISKMVKSSLLLFVFIGVIASLYLNSEFKVIKLGSPLGISELPWIIRIFFSALIGVFLPIILYILLLFELNNKKSFMYMFILTCFFAILISFSIQSRAILFLWLVPIISYLFLNTNFFRNKVKVLGILFLLVFITVNIVNYIRHDISFAKINFSETTKNFSRLLIDRWIGLEGLMAVYSYDNKNLNEFIKLTFEFREKQKLDYFTENIAFGEKEKDIVKIATEKSFASLPGPIAYLYLTNNYKILILGLFIIIMVIYLLENIFLNLTNNILLMYLFITFLAFNLSSLGVDLLRNIRYILFYYIVILILTKFLNYLIIKKGS